MEFAERLSKLKASPTLALNAKAKQLAADGNKVFNFSAGEPDFSTHGEIIQTAIRSLESGNTKYSKPGGKIELRQSVCQKLARENNLDFKPEEIVVGFGVKEILFHCFLALLNQDDEVIVPTPYWVSYIDQIQIAGGKPVIVPFVEEEADLLATIEQSITPKTKAILLNSPNNPSGSIVSKSFLSKLGEVLHDRNIWIFSDEIYEYLSFDKPHVSLLELHPNLKERFVLLNGLSKGFAMTGWRVGYAAGPKDFIKLVTGLQSHSSTCLPPFIEDAAIYALENGKPLMQKSLDDLNTRRKKAIAVLQSIPKLSFLAPEGAFYIMLNLEEYFNESISNSLEMSQYLLENGGIAAVPGEAFGMPGYLRFSYAISEKEFAEGITNMASTLTKLT